MFFRLCIFLYIISYNQFLLSAQHEPAAEPNTTQTLTNLLKNCSSDSLLTLPFEHFEPELPKKNDFLLHLSHHQVLTKKELEKEQVLLFQKKIYFKKWLLKSKNVINRKEKSRNHMIDLHQEQTLQKFVIVNMCKQEDLEDWVLISK